MCRPPVEVGRGAMWGRRSAAEALLRFLLPLHLHRPTATYPFFLARMSTPEQTLLIAGVDVPVGNRPMFPVKCRESSQRPESAPR